MPPPTPADESAREVGLRLVPCQITDARAFVSAVHRHHGAPVSGLFAVACAIGDRIVGVAIAGRPVARPLDDGWTYEVTRVGTDGARNGCSILYGAIRRAARALGYLRGITYTLPEEGGASGWIEDGTTPGRSWSVPSRPRKADAQVLGRKTRWMVTEVGTALEKMFCPPQTTLSLQSMFDWQIRTMVMVLPLQT